MKNEVSNLKFDRTPNKSYNTEGNKNYEKFWPYCPTNNILNQFSNPKRKTNFNSFNNKISFSESRKSKNFNKAQQFLSKQKKEYSNIDFPGVGIIYEKLHLNNPYERDNLILQIYHTQNDINKTNKEIKEVKKMQEIIEKENLANKFMIGQLLNKNTQILIRKFR